MTTLFFILLAILLLGILITIHELGHFVAARLTHIPVEEFAIGFGPKLFGWKSRKYETVFSIRAFPLGGFCAFYGEDDPQGGQKLEHPEWSLNNFAVWRRFVVILMGPVMNFVLAFVVAFGFYFFAGSPTKEPVQIVSIEENSPAASAGLQAEDQFYTINGQPVSADTSVQTIQDLLKTTEDVPLLHIEVMREGEIISADVQPAFNESLNKYLIGITISQSYSDQKTFYSIPLALNFSWELCVYAGKAIIGSFANLLKTGEGIDQMAGPVGTINLIAEQTRSFGFEGFISLLIMISINLGLFNLFPIPGLDGSRLLFLVAEKVCSWFGIKINRKFEAIVHLSGFFLLIAVAVFFTYKDILRLFS